MLEVKHINAYYGRIQALWDVTLRIDEGEIVALVGANGAGKSTTLNVISGLLHPDSGSIEFLGQRIETLAPQQIIALGISHIPEGRRLFPDMTIKENLELGAYMSSAWGKREERIEWIYEVFPVLKARSKQLAKTLSGGEQQMLSIGRGIMTEPKLCMLDEASYGLSPLMAKNILTVMRKLREEWMTILLIEQNIKAALDVADRAYVMENGRPVLEGTSESLLQNEHVKVAYLGL
jgi:branched-chain amino acid transport system ATP-binding protein